MFIKDKFSDESYIHICDGLTERRMESLHRIEIRLHDVTTFTTLFTENGKVEMEHLNFCPYCGVDLEKDVFDNI